MRFHKFLFCMLIFCFAIRIAAQTPVNIHLTEKEGLPDREFYGIVEDRKGFIWMAGNKGLTRFDGTTFMTFEHPEKRGLSVFEPVLDTQDRVWCINISGQLFYTEGEELKLYADFKDELKGRLAGLAVSSEYITITTGYVIIIIDLKTKKVTRQTIEEGIQFAYGSVMNDTIYFSLNNQIATIVNGAASIHQETHIDLHTRTENRIGEGKLVSLSDHNLLLYYQNEERKRIQFLVSGKGSIPIDFPKEIEGLRISRIVEIDKKLWILTTNGAFMCSIKKDQVVLEEHYFEGLFLTDVIKDTDNNFWFSTLKDGIYVLPNVYIKNIIFPDRFKRPTAMIQGKDQDLLVGFTNGDVIAYDPISRQQRIIDLPDNRSVSAMTYDHYNNRYLLFQDVRNYRMSTSNDKVLKEDVLKLVAVKKMYMIDDSQIMYVGSGEASIKPYPESKRGAPSFSKKKRGYTCIENPMTGLNYFALVDELIALDDEGKEFQITTAEGDQILTQSLAITSDGHVWASTFTNGLYEIEGTRVLSHTTETSGLLSNRTGKVATDGNDIWISTSKGIQYLQRKDTGEIIFKNLKKQDGIPSYDIKDIVVGEDEVYFCSSNTVFSVAKKQSFKEFKVPEVYFTKVKINKEEQPIKEAYTLKESESATTISFNANGFRGLSSGSFKYRLKGLDDDWISLKQGVNEIQYANLSYGKYIFQLTTDDSNDKGAIPKEIRFRVTQVFYKFTLFWLGMMAIFLVFTILYYRLMIKKEKQKRQKELAQIQVDKELIALKLENLQSQMNPHFIFNALNSIQEYIVHNEKDLASSYLVKFSRLIRMYLDQSRENTVALAEELEAMKLYLQLEKIRFEDKLLFEIICDPSLNTLKIKVPPLFIQPYVENALKHGLLHRSKNRRLKVAFLYNTEEHCLEVIVQDNGIGRKAAQAIKDSHPQYHTSFATYANKKRVELLNRNRIQKIIVTTTDLYEGVIAKGTKIHIKIPQ